MGRSLPDARFEAMPFSGDGWTLTAADGAERLDHAPPVFALGNGFIGLRGPGERPGAPRVYLNGIFEKMPIAYHEAAHGYTRSSDTRLPVADATGLRIAVDGAAADGIGRLDLDLRRGVLTRTVVCGGVEIRIERLVSMARASTIVTRVTLRALGGPARVSLVSAVSAPPSGAPGQAEDAPYDPRVGPEFGQNPWVEVSQVATGRALGRIDQLRASGFAVAAFASRIERTVDLAAGDSVTIDCFAVYGAQRGGDADALVSACAADLDAAEAAGFDTIAAEQADWFERYWDDAWIAFPAAPRAEQAMRHALFQLVQAAGDGSRSVSAKGQTGEGYEGHVFWDAESYALPLFVYTRPEIARAMLVWRIERLEAARANARAMGQPHGALYPWRTIEGGECSSFFPAGSAQYHINADVAYALHLYVETTGDRSILAEGGAEMLAETARIWLQIGYHDPARGDAFVINSVTGPDEYTALVDNNLFTNMMAAEHLRFAADAASDQLAHGEAAAMLHAADSMHRPFDEARGVYAQDDGFFAREPWPFDATPADRYPLLIHYHPLTIYRHQVAKQADAVLATVLLRDCFEPAVRARMLDTYEAVTVHDSTLSASAFATAAANSGDAARAWHYWRVSLLTDLADLFGNSDHGLHMAALAGSWTALAFGFGGMRTIDSALSFAPIAVPQLGAYAFRIRYRASVVELSVDDAVAVYRLVSGPAVDLTHDGDALTLTPGVAVERPLRR